MKLVVASDHAAVPERQSLAEHLRQSGHEVTDLGCAAGTSVDYPDIAAEAARRVASGAAQLGFVLCGSGNGVCMAANKVPGVRAAVITDEFTAEMARRHNDANVACMGARLLSQHAMIRLADKFLAAPFDGGRHATRVAKLSALDAAGHPSRG